MDSMASWAYHFTSVCTVSPYCVLETHWRLHTTHDTLVVVILPSGFRLLPCLSYCGSKYMAVVVVIPPLNTHSFSQPGFGLSNTILLFEFGFNGTSKWNYKIRNRPLHAVPKIFNIIIRQPDPFTLGWCGVKWYVV